MSVSKPTSKQAYDKKHQLAYTLYVDNGLDQKVIAGLIGVTEKTISKWKSDDEKKQKNWEEDRAELRQGFEKERRRIKKHINFILDGIEEAQRVASAAESDSVNKLASAAEKLLTNLSLSDKMETGKEFFGFMQRKYGHSIALEMLEHWNEFIMQA